MIQTKIKLIVSVYEDINGRPIVHYDMEEDNCTMKDCALLVYKLKQIEQELIDRVWDNGGEGYEIIGED